MRRHRLVVCRIDAGCQSWTNMNSGATVIGATQTALPRRGYTISGCCPRRGSKLKLTNALPEG